jgi:poly(3-hydroxybutyrate) depolymerase
MVKKAGFFKRRRSDRLARAIGVSLGACIIFFTAVHGAGELEFAFTSSFDSSRQKAAGYVPEGYGDGPAPLLAVAHYWGGSRFTAKHQGYYAECEKRAWLLVCPELHGRKTGGGTSFASREAQHDMVDAIAYMRKNYRVDSTRIYCAGRSMGGMLAAMMAAKYPDLFAAVVAGQGISDLKQWTDSSAKFRGDVEKECGVYSEATRFEYARRSPVNYAPNLAYVPLVLWHGTNDTWVAPQQTSKLDYQIRLYFPYQPQVHWLAGAPHCAANYTPEWICDRLQFYQNVCEQGMDVPGRFYRSLDIVADESIEFFWLGIEAADTTGFARVRASLEGDSLFVDARNCGRVTIDEKKIAAGQALRRCRIEGAAKVFVKRDGKEMPVAQAVKESR